MKCELHIVGILFLPPARLVARVEVIILKVLDRLRRDVWEARPSSTPLSPRLLPLPLVAFVHSVHVPKGRGNASYGKRAVEG